MSIAEKLLEELREREDIRRALAEELPELFKDRRLRIVVLTVPYKDIATKQDRKDLKEETYRVREDMYRIREELGGEVVRLRDELVRLRKETIRRIDSIFKWIVGSIVGVNLTDSDVNA